MDTIEISLEAALFNQVIDRQDQLFRLAKLADKRLMKIEKHITAVHNRNVELESNNRLLARDRDILAERCKRLMEDTDE